MSIFTHIKSKVNILDIVTEYTKLKRAGNYWKGHCPFHNEKTASFTVSPDKEIFYCFGCHIGGDAITFIAKAENCSPMEAAQHIAKRYQIPLPGDLKANFGTTKEEKNKYFSLCKLVALWCNGQLEKAPHVKQYLQNRGFMTKATHLFTLGYFPGGIRSIKSLLSHASQHSFMQQDLIDAKIISEGKTGLYSPFEDRIIFPIKDLLGQFCGFGGRIFKPNDQRAKYYNSHENSYFNKGSLLFGFDLAKKQIKNVDHIFLVEGYTDCLAMAQSGFPNTVATLGTACTLDHLKLLSRYVHQLYVMYDGDNAGQKAIIRLTELCWQVDLELKVINLPQNDDPASFLQNGGTLQKVVREAKDIFIFFIDTTAKDFMSKPLSQKLRLAKSIIHTITNLQDPIKKDILLQRASKSLGIPIESIKSIPTKMTNKQTLKSETMPWQEYPGQALEKKIFFAIINNMKLLNKYNEEFLEKYFPSPLKDILTKLKLAKIKVPSLKFTSFFDSLGDNERQYISKIVLEFDEDIEEKTFEQLLLQFQKKNWKQIVQSIKNKLSQAKKDSNDTEVTHILQQFLDLKGKLLDRGLIGKDSK